MTNQLERTAVLQTAFMATISVCAALGFWSLITDFAPAIGAVVVPGVWLTFTALLLTSSRLELQRSYEAGMAFAHVDQLTRLPSQVVAQRMLATEFAAAERGRALSIVCFSIDEYGKLASEFGPAETKRLLIGMGTMLKRRTRDMNLSFRFDDRGTFISVLGGIPLEGAVNFANKVHKDVAALRIGDRPVSVSSSVCVYDASMHSAEDLVARAQRNLTAARRKGAGQVAVDGDNGIGENEGYAVLAH